MWNCIHYFEHTLPKNRDSGLPMNCISYGFRKSNLRFLPKMPTPINISHRFTELSSLKNEISFILKPLIFQIFT